MTDSFFVLTVGETVRSEVAESLRQRFDVDFAVASVFSFVATEEDSVSEVTTCRRSF